MKGGPSHQNDSKRGGGGGEVSWGVECERGNGRAKRRVSTATTTTMTTRLSNGFKVGRGCRRQGEGTLRAAAAAGQVRQWMTNDDDDGDGGDGGD